MLSVSLRLLYWAILCVVPLCCKAVCCFLNSYVKCIHIFSIVLRQISRMFYKRGYSVEINFITYHVDNFYSETCALYLSFTLALFYAAFTPLCHKLYVKLIGPFDGCVAWPKCNAKLARKICELPASWRSEFAITKILSLQLSMLVTFIYFFFFCNKSLKQFLCYFVFLL